MKALYIDKQQQLIQMYQHEELSLNQISKKIGIAKGTIGKWLKRFNIPARNISEGIHLRTGNHCVLSDKAKDWINGELLGDGCLQTKSKYSACFTYGSKHYSYINYISRILLLFGIKQAGNILKRYHKDWGNTSYSYVSKNYVELLDIRKQWYLNGKKTIPDGINLNPLTCRQWYIGDGHLYHYGVKNKAGIVLSTCGFTVNEVNGLINKLELIGIKATRQPSRGVVNISTQSTNDFFSYIGACPIKCYEYKWPSFIGEYGLDALQPVL